MKEKLAAAAAIAKSKAVKVKDDSDDDDDEEIVLELKASPNHSQSSNRVKTVTGSNNNSFENDRHRRLKNQINVDSGNDASSEDSNDSKGSLVGKMQPTVAKRLCNMLHSVRMWICKPLFATTFQPLDLAYRLS